jgi:mannose-P-dolichol utilization defect protein 1
VDDKLILYNFIAGFFLNAVLAAQMIYYWNAPSKPVKGKGKGKAALGANTPSASSTGTFKAKTPTTRRRG